MPVITVNGQQVTVGDEFMRLSPEQQDATVDEIAQGMAAQPKDNWAPPGILAPIQYNLGPDGKPVGVRPAMPRLLTDAWNAIQAPGKAFRGEYDQLEIGPNGEVSPFDPRMVDDAAALGSMISPTSAASKFGTAFGAQVPRKAAAAAMPEIDDLYRAKDAAYKNVDTLGARYSGEAIDQLYMDMYRRVGEANIDPMPDGVHKATVRMLERLADREGPMSLTRLDQLRQLIRRDVMKSGTEGDAEMGRLMMEAIDDFIENAGPHQISGVTGETANWAIKTARQANTILRKSETLQEALENARFRAASSGSGGNIDNAIRQELRKIVMSERKSMGFTADEIAAMKAIIDRESSLSDIMRVIGKLSPSGNGLMAALGIGASAFNPVLAALPAAGLVSKAITDNATQGAAQRLTQSVRTGGAKPPPVASRASSITPKANTTLIQENFGPGMLPTIPVKIRLDA